MSISFAGGGTDLPSYYSKYGGLAITATIDKYAYVVASALDGQPTQITKSSDYQSGFSGSDGSDSDSRVLRAIVEHLGLTRGLSVFIASQVPTGAGLGSITAESVALVKALSALHGDHLDQRSLAVEVSRLEVDELKLPFGRQDHYSISFGGLNCITFGVDAIDVEPMELPEQTLRELERRLMLFFTGRPSNWNQLLVERQRGSDRNRATVIEALHVTKQVAIGMRNDLERGEIESLGDWLDRAWLSKKRVAPGISDAWIDQWYDTALKAGAAGGKIVGPGGGGFLLLYCQSQFQEAVTRALESAGLLRLSFNLEPNGPAVLMNTEQEVAVTSPLGVLNGH